VADTTRPATWEDLKQVARLLDEEGVAYALVGGYAIAVHGFVRASEDLDLLVDPSPDNTRRWIAALSRLPDGAARELQGEDDLFASGEQGAIRINDEFTIDVLPAACGHSWADLAPYVERRDLDGVSVAVLGLEGLLRTKEGMRDRDRADAAVLRAALAAIRSRP
jgi:hypothetical protein